MMEKGTHVFVCRACDSDEPCTLVADGCCKLPICCPWTGPVTPEWERVY